MAKRNLYCIDDNVNFIDLLARRLEKLDYNVCVFHSGDAFLSKVKRLGYGCVLLDVRMPGVSGNEVLDHLSRLSPRWPVLMMSGQCSVDDTVRSFRAGAIHLLQKPFTMEELKGSLEEACALGDSLLEKAERARQASLVSLSKREKEILQGLAAGKQSKQIAWELGISVRTADLHRSRLFAKLGVQNAHAALVAGYDLGLLEPKG